jgi:probable phosphoglycerate mutase
MPPQDAFEQELSLLPAKPFFLLRHGQSVANAARITAGGRLDSPLTELGRDQARALAPYMPTLPIKPVRLFHSSMKRAAETAMIVNDLISLPAVSMYELREHEFGDWEDRPWTEIEPLLVTGRNPPNGEPESVFAQRIQAAFTTILEASDDVPLIVAHGGLFHAIGSLYEYAMSEVNNCHLHYFEPTDEWDEFPWRVWQFDIENEMLVKKPAPFCLSQTLKKIGVRHQASSSDT